jgi:hypothetical protein
MINKKEIDQIVSRLNYLLSIGEINKDIMFYNEIEQLCFLLTENN